MKLDELYEGLSKFWETLASAVMAHVAAFALIVLTGSGDLQVLPWLDRVVLTPEYRQAKALLVEFELWKQLPFILLVALVLYVLAFKKLSGLVLQFPLFTFRYSPTEFFIARKPFAELRGFLPHVPPSGDPLGQLTSALELFIAKFQIEYAAYHEQTVAWARKGIVKWMGIYSALCTMTAGMSCLLLWVLIRPTDQVVPSRLALATLGMAILTALARLKNELLTESELRQKLSFTRACLAMQSVDIPADLPQRELRLYESLTNSHAGSLYDWRWLLAKVRRIPWLRTLGACHPVSLNELNDQYPELAARLSASRTITAPGAELEGQEHQSVRV